MSVFNPQAGVRIQSYRHELITDDAAERAACKFNMLREDSDYFKMSSVNFVGSLLYQMGLNGTIEDGKASGFSHDY